MGKTLGQIAYETASPKSDWHEPWEIVPDFARVGWEAAAQAVRSKVIEDCIQELNKPLTVAASHDVIIALEDLRELHIEALTALKDQSNG